MGAFIALAGAFGMVTSQQGASQVDAQIPAGFQVTKVCGTTNVTIGGTTTCTVTVTATAALAFNEPLVLSVTNGQTSGTGTNPEFGRVLLLAGTSGATGPDVDNVQVTNPVNGLAQTITVNCTGATCDFAAGDAIVITEGVRGAVGGPTSETLRFGAGVPVVLAPSVTVAPATIAAAVSCTGGTLPIGSITAGSGAAGASTCTVTLADNDLIPNFVSSGTINVVVTGPAGTVLSSTGTTSGSFNCGNSLNSPQSCAGFTFGLQSTTGSTVSGPVSVQLTYVPDLPAVDQGVVLNGGTVANVVGIATSNIAAVSSCTPGVGGVAGLGAITVGTGATGATTCTITFSDNSGVTTSIASGNFSVSVISNTGVVIATPTVTGQTVQIRCGAVGLAEGCTTITVVLQSPVGSTATGIVGLQLNYVSDVPAVNPSTVLTLNNVAQVAAAAINIAALIQPAGLRITCTSVLDANAPQTLPIQLPTPAQISASNIIAIGTLPATLSCTAVPIDAAGAVLAAVAPGVIEVSSTGGVIVDAQGRISTDIPIGCDLGSIAAVTVLPGATINGNVCTGVAFRVAGQQVGNVELRARYLPSSASVVAGITERDTTATVAFVAPFVSVSLLLNPNPITANGGTGVATARLNRTFNCSVTFGQNINGGTACIDPTTGLPIVFNLGSSLNGTVLYNIDNTAIAVWADAVTSTQLSAPQTNGFIATASQISKRCGLFATAGFPSTVLTQPSFTGALGNFFGGCESTTATYRGVLPGTTNITATFVPDLPGAFGSAAGLTGPVASLFGFGGSAFNTSTRLLEVVAPAPSGSVQLSRGCNNVSPTVSEAAAAYAARVAPQGSLVAIWEHQAATNTFRGFSPQAGAPSDLASVTRLRPVFVCVSGAATLDQPAA